jgi:hypothetical protein
MSVATFTCPVCERTTDDPNDVRERYCARCHGITTSAPPGWRWVRFKASTCADFGRLLLRARAGSVGSRYEQIAERRVFEYDGEAFVEIEHTQEADE